MACQYVSLLRVCAVFFYFVSFFLDGSFNTLAGSLISRGLSLCLFLTRLTQRTVYEATLTRESAASRRKLKAHFEFGAVRSPPFAASCTFVLFAARRSAETRDKR